MSRRKRSTSSVSTFQIMGMVLLLLAVLIALALMLAPRKPKAPPTSGIAYATRPPVREVHGRAPSRIPGTPPPSTKGSDAAPPAQPEEGEPEAEPYTISGTVRDSKTGEPIPGARVHAQRQWTADEEAAFKQRDAEVIRNRDVDALDALKAEEQRLRAFRRSESKRTGHYAISVPAEGRYLVTAYRAGYVNAQVDAGFLGKDRTQAVLDVEMSSGASVRGRVTEQGSSYGAPELRVQVEVEGDVSDVYYRSLMYSDGRRLTDADGNYAVSGLLPGSYAISLDLSDSPYKVGRVLPYAKVTITDPDQELTGIDFAVEAAGVVWGYVTTPKHEAIEHADVVLCNSDSVLTQALKHMVRRAPPLHDRSEYDGYYELIGVPFNEEWRVYATSESHSPQLTDSFLLTAAQRSVQIDVFMFAGTTVYGRVIEPDGTPIPGAHVLCIPGYTKLLSRMDAPQAYRECTSDNAGEFVIKELPAGSYQVFGQKKGYKLSATGEPIYPNGYTDITGMRLVLNPVDAGEHAVYGTVTDTNKKPVEGADVILEGIGMESFDDKTESTTTDSQGKFYIADVETGMWSLQVSKQGYATKRLGRVFLDRENTVVLEAAAWVRGKVLVRETKNPPEVAYTVAVLPPSGSDVSIEGLAAGRQSQTFQNPDGRFEISVSPGAHRLEARAQGFTPGRTAINAAAGEVLDGITLYVSQEGGTIEGRVVIADGTSPQGVTVRLVEAGTATAAMVSAVMDEFGGERSMRVGDDGRFVFTDLPAGTYNLIARHEQHAPADSGVVELEEGGFVSGVLIRLGAGGSLDGYVYRNGQPLADAVVMAMGTSGTQSTNTDQNGYYRIDELSEGSYQITVASLDLAGLADGGGAQGALVEIVEGQTTRYNFGAGEGVRIEGRCSPPPTLVGYLVLGAPGARYATVGESVGLDDLFGQSATFGANGFVVEDVQPGDWQLDIFYLEPMMDKPLRYVHSEMITITGEEEAIQLNLAVKY